VEAAVDSAPSSLAELSVLAAVSAREDFTAPPCSETNSERASETMASKAAALCSKGIPGSGTGTGNNTDEASALPAFAPVSVPSRTAASCAFVFQSARRKRSAAVLYHFAASAFMADVSKYFANSKATMAS
jgi:hypothetical protein